MGHERVPVFEELNQKLMAATGWRIVAVTGLVPDAIFFEHLANRRFPVTWWVRAPEQMDYLQEPDCFHDVFGHVPLLINPVFADYMQAYGQGGMKAEHLHVLPMLARLYWYTVEFGLIQTEKGLRIYGAGIVSSKTESIYALESQVPNRVGFDLTRILRTEYKIDDVQKTYFVIDDFDTLMNDTQQDFTQMYLNLDGLPTFKPTEILAQDRVINKGVTP
jgi:phenylalanine-4-hydroxylase